MQVKSEIFLKKSRSTKCDCLCSENVIFALSSLILSSSSYILFRIGFGRLFSGRSNIMEKHKIWVFFSFLPPPSYKNKNLRRIFREHQSKMNMKTSVEQQSKMKASDVVDNDEKCVFLKMRYIILLPSFPYSDILFSLMLTWITNTLNETGDGLLMMMTLHHRIHSLWRSRIHFSDRISFKCDWIRCLMMSTNVSLTARTEL